MTEPDVRFLEAFVNWLKSLPADAELVAEAVRNSELSEATRRPLAAALNYLFKSLDLIDDGIEGLGFLDDAFVLRLAVAQAGQGAPSNLEVLAQGAELIDEFLGTELSARMGQYVHALGTSVVRGRSVDAILSDETVREELLAELAGWASRYEKPIFTADPKNLVKLRAFLAAKLPA